MNLKAKLISGLTSLALVGTLFSQTAFAATETYANGEYTANSTMYKNSSGVINTSATSSCDNFFAHEVEVTLTDDATTVVWYMESATDYGMNPVDNFTVTYNDASYDAVIDFENDVVKEINGESHNANKVTLTLPADAIDALVNDGLLVASYVPAMGSWGNVTYWAKLSNIQVAPAETFTQTSELTASVDKNTPNYTVTVPSSIALGTLSRTEDTSVEFNVEVEADYFEDESVEIVASAAGKLISDADDEIAFANDFGTQTATESTSLSGNIKVNASDVASAKGGNYTGTTTFVINYYEGE